MAFMAQGLPKAEVPESAPFCCLTYKQKIRCFDQEMINLEPLQANKQVFLEEYSVMSQ